MLANADQNVDQSGCLDDLIEHFVANDVLQWHAEHPYELMPANEMLQPVKPRHTARGIKRLRQNQLVTVKDMELKAKLALMVQTRGGRKRAKPTPPTADSAAAVLPHADAQADLPSVIGVVTAAFKIGSLVETLRCIVLDLPSPIDVLMTDDWLHKHRAVLDYNALCVVLHKRGRTHVIKCIAPKKPATAEPKPLVLLTAQQCKKHIRKYQTAYCLISVQALEEAAKGAQQPAPDKPLPPDIAKLIQQYPDVFAEKPCYGGSLIKLDHVSDSWDFIIRLKDELLYLGHIISADGVKVDPAKTKAVDKYAPPTDVHGLRRFLGMANFFRKFIKGYAQMFRG